jgi:Uma2 family endonuclease
VDLAQQRLTLQLKNMTTTPLPGLDKTPTDQWVPADWSEFQRLATLPAYQGSRGYYDQGVMRLEMAALGPMHGHTNALVARLINLFATVRGIRILEFTNTSFAQPGLRECQPDSAFYINATAQLPLRTNTAVEVPVFGAPNLVLEIASTTLSDDLGNKRLLYERLGVQEYWVIDAQANAVIAFAIQDGGSREIRESRLLPGLAMTLVEEALRRGQAGDDGEVNRWLLERFREM